MKRIALISIGIAALALFIWVALNSERKTTIRWDETYFFFDKNPFGGYLAYHMTQAIQDSNRFEIIDSSIVDQLIIGEAGSNYFFLGEELYLSEAEENHLESFVWNGGNAFISSYYYNLPWLDSLVGGPYLNEVALPDSFISITLAQSDRTFKALRPRLQDSLYYLNYFQDSTRYPAFGFFSWESQSLPIATTIPYGDGLVVLHLFPPALSNHFLRTPDGKLYLEYLLGTLPKGPSYWDQVSLLPHLSGGGRPGTQSPLRFIFSHPPLTWAWYLLIIGGILFVLNSFRRKRPPIPIEHPLENASQSYVKTVGDVYFQSGDTKHVAEMKLKIILDEIKIKFKSQNPVFSEEWIAEMATRTSVSTAEWSQLKTRRESVHSQSEMNPYEWIALSQLIQNIRIKVKL